MENRKTFTYNGVNSADYGLYISGDSVYNAPSRVYEMVDIAGRNGQLAIDQGRFENIEVTYPAFIFAETQTEFAQRLRDIRAWLMSPVGYQRLEDTYHPDEFRMAIYMSGLEADPTHYNEAGEFELTFNCKPQRFLKSGEEEIVLGEWGETQTVSGSIATFEAEANTGIKSLVVNIEPIQSGSGDPSPTNVRPIEGWSGVNVEHLGANILKTDTILGWTNVQVVDGTVTATREDTRSWSPILQAYKDSTFVRNLGTAIQSPFAFTKDDTFNRLLFGHSGATVDIKCQIELNDIPNGDYYFSWEMISSTDIFSWHNMMISTTATTYEPCQGSTITKSLGRTVYGGTLDLISGLMTVDKAYYNFDGSEAFSIYGSYTYGARFVTPALDSNAKSVQGALMTNRFSHGAPNSYINISSGTSRTNFYIRSGDLGEGVELTVANLKSWLSSHNVQVVYELATPLTYQLTPETIQTLLGVNNIWADSGEVSVEYGEDPNLLINPSPFEALPLIEVVGVGSLTVGNITVTITGESTQDIFIDSDIMEAYEDDNGAIISRNDRINLSGMHFPTLGTETGITNTGLTSVTVTPRWWTI